MNGRFGIETSVFTTGPAAHHAIRRKALNPYFSRRSIGQCEPLADQLLSSIYEKFIGYKERDQVLNIGEVWTAFSGDIITEYSFGFSYEQVESDDFKDTFQDAYMAAAELGCIALQFPWITPIFNALPDNWVEPMNPSLGKLLKLQRVRYY
jgi:cytochrome P450